MSIFACGGFCNHPDSFTGLFSNPSAMKCQETLGTWIRWSLPRRFLVKKHPRSPVTAGSDKTKKIRFGQGKSLRFVQEHSSAFGGRLVSFHATTMPSKTSGFPSETFHFNGKNWEDTKSFPNLQKSPHSYCQILVFAASFFHISQ